MLNQLPEIAVPSWLNNLSPTTIRNGSFPLQEFLQNSLYYPASGFDGDPIRYLAGNILSFIYVDYGHAEDEFMDALGSPGFRGYDLVATRPVIEQELAPNGWNPILPARIDGDPFRYRDRTKNPFYSWSVFQRRDDVPVNHGPSRFSLLYLCADGVAAFQALYIANAAVPKAVAVIQPGHAFGGNWTDYTDPKQIFARSVLENPSGRPTFLLYGGIGKRDYYRQSCWPDYQAHICFVDKVGGTIGIWSNNTHRCYATRCSR